MAKLPQRAFGLLLLTLSVSVAGCQALFHGVTLPSVGMVIEQDRN